MAKQIKSNLIGIEINEMEARLICEIRRVKFGDIKIHIKNGLPYRIVKIQKSILLTEPAKKNSS